MPALALAQQTRTGLVSLLYQEARTGLINVPDIAATLTLAEIGSDEASAFPDRSEDDLQHAFYRALALTASANSSDTTGRIGWSVKAEVEQRAISELTRRNHYEDALDLARLADVPRGPLYDLLLEALARGNVPANQRLDQLQQLVNECRNADGTYPYQGVDVAMRAFKLDAIDRFNLLTDAYAWAANQTDPGQDVEAATLLRDGHKLSPELDGQLVAVLDVMLAHLAAASMQAGANVPAAAGPRLMELLRQVDPGAAALAAADYPSFSGPDFGATTSEDTPVNSTVVVKDQNGDQVMSFPITSNLRFVQANGTTGIILPGTPPPAASDVLVTSGAGQFRQLLAQAEALRKRDPRQAWTLANRAEGLLDANLWQSQLDTVVRLPVLYHDLGDNRAAGRLLQRALQEAESQAHAFDLAFANAGSDQQATMQQDLLSAAPAIMDAYTSCARLDLDTTARKLEAAQFTLLKPLLLDRLAITASLADRSVPVN